MSYPTTVKGQKIAVQLGNGATPEVFTTVCGVTDKGFQRTRQTSDVVVWDCTNPDAPPITESDILSGSWTISIGGQVVLAELDRLEEAYDTPDTWRIVLFSTGTTVVRSYTGTAIMTDFNITANNGSRATVAITLKGDGELVQA